MLNNNIYLVRYNSSQEENKKKLESEILRNRPKIDLEYFNHLIEDLKKELSKQLKKESGKSCLIENNSHNSRVNRDELLGSLRRIIMSYNFLEGVGLEPDRHDERQIYLVAMFHNIRALSDIIPRRFLQQNNVFKKAKEVRDLFMHSYDKDIEGNQKAVIRLDYNLHLESGLLEIMVFRLFDSEYLYSFFFCKESIICDIFDCISKWVTELKKS